MRLSTLALAGALLVLACGTSDSTSTPQGTGSVRVQLTDAPFPFDSVEKVEVHVVRVDARLQTADSAAAADVSENSGAWVTLVEPDKLFELLALRGGKLADLGDSQLAAGTYRGLRLIIDVSKSSLTLKNGMVLTGASSPGVIFPSAGQTGLKINIDGGVVVSEQDATTLVIDFDVGESFVMRGNSITQNGLLFKPTLSATVQ
jgi:hypothetical protein